MDKPKPRNIPSAFTWREYNYILWQCVITQSITLSQDYISKATEACSEDARFSHSCGNLRLDTTCLVFTLTQWLDATLSQWLDTTLSQWLDATLSQWLDATLSQWLDVTLSQWLDATLSQWLDTTLSQWLDTTWVLFSLSVNGWTTSLFCSHSPSMVWTSYSVNGRTLLLTCLHSQ